MLFFSYFFFVRRHESLQSLGCIIETPVFFWASFVTVLVAINIRLMKFRGNVTRFEGGKSQNPESQCAYNTIVCVRTKKQTYCVVY